MEDGNIALNWLASADDKVVGFINYRGHAVSIPGVASYNVWRSVDDGDWEMVGSVEQGATSFVDENVPEGASMVIYRVDAADLDNQMPSEELSVPVTGYVSFTDADGSLIYVVDLSPGRTDFTPSIRDIVALAGAFGSSEDDANYLEQADTNQDGSVDLRDFQNFASTFGIKPSLRNGRPIGATKVVMVPRLGVNEDAEMLLSNNTDRVLVGQQISLDVSVANTKALKGFGFVLTFDSEKFEFLKAAPAENDLLKSAGGETPVFFERSEQSGQIMVANSLVDGEVVSGEGSVVTLTFKVLKEFEDNAPVRDYRRDRIRSQVALESDGCPGRVECRDYAYRVRVVPELPESVQPRNHDQVQPGGRLRCPPPDLQYFGSGGPDDGGRAAVGWPVPGEVERYG